MSENLQSSTLHHGDCLEVLKTIPDNSIDSLVSDPPAGIAFMGKEWDKDKGGRSGWVAWMTEIMKECNRVMKPGAHGLVWALPRTSHWTATALEDSGFEIRDVITHLFGSGFPKSMDIGKKDQRYDGMGTALKPANEHWILVRKKLSEKTVIANVDKWGCGAINIDVSRIVPSKDYGRSATNSKGTINAHNGFEGKSFKIAERDGEYVSPLGRFPSNLVFTHSVNCTDDSCDMFDCPVGMLNEQGGPCKTGGRNIKTDCGDAQFKVNVNTTIPEDHGSGASRFFYCAKVSQKERNVGCEDLDKKEKPTLSNYKNPSEGRQAPKNGSPQQNNHPTVKSKKLMSYLINLITPPNGIVLDPFMGSGSTGIAAKECGFNFIGIEKEKEYFEIAQKRIEACQHGPNQNLKSCT